MEPWLHGVAAPASGASATACVVPCDTRVPQPNRKRPEAALFKGLLHVLVHYALL